MSIKSAQWLMICRWLLGGVLYGLIWGAAVALLITLSGGKPTPEAAWTITILARTEIGALAGAFFGLLAGLLIAQARLQMDFGTLPGRSALRLLVALGICFGCALSLYYLAIVPWLATVPWHVWAEAYRPLLYGATLLVIPLALLPLLTVHPRKQIPTSATIRPLPSTKR